MQAVCAKAVLTAQGQLVGLLRSSLAVLSTDGAQAGTRSRCFMESASLSKVPLPFSKQEWHLQSFKHPLPHPHPAHDGQGLCRGQAPAGNHFIHCCYSYTQFVLLS